MDIKESIECILKNMIKPAVGCTDPASIALVTCAATSVIPDDIKKIELFLSQSVYKNGMHVGIPNSSKIGHRAAASLGASVKDYSSGMRILENISDKEKEYADKLLSNGLIKVNLADVDENIYLECIVESVKNSSRAVIKGIYDNLVLIEVNGETIYSKKDDNLLITSSNGEKNFFTSSIEDIINEIEKLEFTAISHLLEGFEMNKTAAEIGMREKWGIGVGYALNLNMEKGIIAKDLPNLAMVMTAAATDVRMGGAVIPMMASNGSGNHGLAVILPIVAYSQLYETDDVSLAKAIAIGHVLTGYIKHYLFTGSPLCGSSIAAATAAGCAIIWLLGGDYTHMQGVINNMLANLTGVVCDGAKPGCSFKMGTSVAASVQSAIIAMDGFYARGNNGIVTGSAEENIINLGIFSKEGMCNSDSTVIDIVMSKNCNK